MRRHVCEAVDQQRLLPSQTVEVVPLQRSALSKCRVHEEELHILSVDAIVIEKQGKGIVEVVLVHAEVGHYNQENAHALL